MVKDIIWGKSGISISSGCFVNWMCSCVWFEARHLDLLKWLVQNKNLSRQSLQVLSEHQFSSNYEEGWTLWFIVIFTAVEFPQVSYCNCSGRVAKSNLNIKVTNYLPDTEFNFRAVTKALCKHFMSLEFYMLGIALNILKIGSSRFSLKILKAYGCFVSYGRSEPATQHCHDPWVKRHIREIMVNAYQGYK